MPDLKQQIKSYIDREAAEIHLENILNCIPDFENQWGSNDRIDELIGGYRGSYDMSLSFDQQEERTYERIAELYGLTKK